MYIGIIIFWPSLRVTLRHLCGMAGVNFRRNLSFSTSHVGCVSHSIGLYFSCQPMVLGTNSNANRNFQFWVQWRRKLYSVHMTQLWWSMAVEQLWGQVALEPGQLWLDSSAPLCSIQRWSVSLCSTPHWSASLCSQLHCALEGFLQWFSSASETQSSLLGRKYTTQDRGELAYMDRISHSWSLIGLSSFKLGCWIITVWLVQKQCPDWLE